LKKLLVVPACAGTTIWALQPNSGLARVSRVRSSLKAAGPALFKPEMLLRPSGAQLPSRVAAGMAIYAISHPQTDILLFQPNQDWSVVSSWHMPNCV
jgi:hypothetical protein